MAGRLVILCCLAGADAGAVPAITAVVNAATWGFPAVASSGIAQGSIFVVFGSELGPDAVQYPSGFPLPRTLADTSVRITSGTTTTDAILIYTSATQVAAILPSSTPTGVAYVAVTYAGHTSQSGAFRVLRSAPGVFTENQGGTGPAVAQNLNSASDQPRNSLTRAARPGQVVTLWGTGVGPVAGDEASAPVPANLDVPLEVLVGGKPATVRYRGRSGCCAGIDQISFEVPAGVDGCQVPIVLRSGDAISNFSTIAIAASGGSCTDVSGMTGEVLEKVYSGGAVRYGRISLILSRDEWWDDMPHYTEGASGQFVVSNFQTNSGLPLDSPSPGSCLVSPAAITIPPNRLPTTLPLDAGAALNLSGPKGTREVPRAIPGQYYAWFNENAVAPVYFVPGSYVIDNGGGGRDVGPFRATLAVPAPFSATVQQAPGSVLVNWTGGDPAGYVMIQGFSMPVVSRVPVRLVCTARVAAGQFSLPTVVLATLPVDTAGAYAMNFLVNGVTQTTFRAAGLDVGQVSFLQ